MSNCNIRGLAASMSEKRHNRSESLKFEAGLQSKEFRRQEESKSENQGNHCRKRNKMGIGFSEIITFVL